MFIHESLDGAIQKCFYVTSYVDNKDMDCLVVRISIKDKIIFENKCKIGELTKKYEIINSIVTEIYNYFEGVK